MQSYSTIFPQVKREVSALFGDETCLSEPIPDVTAGVRVERYFLYPVNRQTMRSRPFGYLTTSMESGQVLLYQDCRVRDFMDTGEHPFSEPISYALQEKIGVRQFRTEQSLLRKLYESVRTFAFQDTLTEEQKQTLESYLVLLFRSQPAALLPYYSKMGKNFFRWGYTHVG